MDLSGSIPAYKKERPIAIAKSVEKSKLGRWGFVIVRCTYGSQKKWDKLLALVKQSTRQYFEGRQMPEVYEMAIWTVIEDPATLDGVGIAESSKRFTEWAKDDEGEQKREEIIDGARRYIPYYPRYTFYLHVDEESLESVVDEAKAAEADANCLKVVMADMVLTGEEQRRQAAQNGEEEEEEDEDEDESLDERKKVRIGEIAPLYATLLSHNRWYNILTWDGVCDC